jgi:Gas vesicle protein K
VKRSKRVAASPVTAAELRLLREELQRRMGASDARLKSRAQSAGGGARGFSRAAPLRWNPQPDDVQRSVAQLVLTIVEFLRKLMERQAIRRMEQKTLTRKEVDDIGRALMQLEETVRDIGARFGLTPQDLNLDLGPLGKLM